MEQDRFVSINENYSENQRNMGFRRMLNNRNRNNEIINDNYALCTINKTKLILLLIITIILSLSNYFYNWNNNISIIKDEPRTILSLFDNTIFKVNPPLNEQNKLTQIRNLKEEKNEEITNKTNDKVNNNNKNKSKIDEFDVFSKISLLKEHEVKKKIFNKLDKFYFKFNWTSFKINNSSSIYKIGDAFKGEGIFSIQKKQEMFPDYIRISMKANEQSFIDNWIVFASDSNLEELSLNYDDIKNSNFIEIKGLFLTTLYKGAFFEIINEEDPKYCQSKYKMIFPYSDKNQNINKNKNHSLLLENIDNVGNIFIDLNNFSLNIESSCGFNFDIKANIYDDNERAILDNKINIYCIITGLSGLFYVVGIYSIIYSINKSENIISVINSDCLLINPIWNTYITLVDINIAMRLNRNFYPFIFLIIFSILKFIYFDFYLLALYWKKKRNYVTISAYVKERLRFYLLYYIISFCSFLWINIFFNYISILALCICLWIPHIIFNIKRNNKYSYPFIYVLSSTIDKLIYPIYFRAYKGNFIECKVNAPLISLMVLFVFFTIIILYAQIFSNPRFMLPKSFHKNEFSFYKTKQDLISIRKDIGLEECVICLSPIFDIESNENNRMIEMEEKSNNKEPVEEEEKLDVLDNSTNNSSLSTINNLNEDECEEKEKIINSNIINNDMNDGNLIENKINNKNNNILNQIFQIFKILFTENFFSFYKRHSTLNGQLYMFTPCSHVFHAECLEKWFEFKKECPNCRISMKEYLE